MLWNGREISKDAQSSQAATKIYIVARKEFKIPKGIRPSISHKNISEEWALWDRVSTHMQIFRRSVLSRNWLHTRSKISPDRLRSSYVKG